MTRDFCECWGCGRYMNLPPSPYILPDRFCWECRERCKRDGKWAEAVARIEQKPQNKQETNKKTLP